MSISSLRANRFDNCVFGVQEFDAKLPGLSDRKLIFILLSRAKSFKGTLRNLFKENLTFEIEKELKLLKACSECRMKTF